jgi:hypothetical protein
MPRFRVISDRVLLGTVLPVMQKAFPSRCQSLPNDTAGDSKNQNDRRCKDDGDPERKQIAYSGNAHIPRQKEIKQRHYGEANASRAKHVKTGKTIVIFNEGRHDGRTDQVNETERQSQIKYTVIHCFVFLATDNLFQV